MELGGPELCTSVAGFGVEPLALQAYSVQQLVLCKTSMHALIALALAPSPSPSLWYVSCQNSGAAPTGGGGRPPPPPSDNVGGHRPPNLKHQTQIMHTEASH